VVADQLFLIVPLFAFLPRESGVEKQKQQHFAILEISVRPRRIFCMGIPGDENPAVKSVVGLV
jgi:hypothetical protein